ncbi:MAG TPA: NADH-quinone oxidoreductase subunit N [Terracidiphilus sp.]|nr:NADH-quinone oxidoreductase subunit N [Terracidiphilus sp.]
MNYSQLFFATLPETVLEIASLVVLVADLAFLRKAELSVRAAVAALLGVAGCGIGLWTIQFEPAGGFAWGTSLLLNTGGYTAVAQAAILVLTALALLLLVDSTFTRHVGEFVAVMLMSAAGGLLISAAQDLIVIFIGLELLSLGLYILTAFAKRSDKSAESAIKYYLFGGMSAAFLLFGFSYLYGLTGSTNLHDIAFAATVSRGASATPLLYVALVMILAGLGFKVAAVPFHLWAPDTYEGAPAPGAAFIASVSKVASFALLIGIGTALLHTFDNLHTGLVFVRIVSRFGFSPRYLGLAAPWMLILLILAVASMVFGNLAALVQGSVRRLVAYSAVAHAGYILLGLAYLSYGPRSTEAILYYVVTYGLTTVGAFAVVDVVERATGSDRMEAFLGLHKRNPIVAFVLLILFLSLAGIPPLVGFWAKFNLFAAVLQVSRGVVPFAIVAVAVAFSAVSLYYYLQVLKRAYVMPAAEESPIRVHPVTLLVLIAVSAGVVVLGCFPALLSGWINGFFSSI